MLPQNDPHQNADLARVAGPRATGSVPDPRAMRSPRRTHAAASTEAHKRLPILQSWNTKARATLPALSTPSPRGAAAPARRAGFPVPPRGGRPRLARRRGRRAEAIRPRGLLLDVRLLHRGPPPLRGRGLPAHQGRPRGARASAAADDARRRPPAPERHREARTGPHPTEPRRPPRAGHAPIQASDSGARRRAVAPARCRVRHAQTAAWSSRARPRCSASDQRGPARGRTRSGRSRDVPQGDGLTAPGTGGCSLVRTPSGPN